LVIATNNQRQIETVSTRYCHYHYEFALAKMMKQGNMCFIIALFIIVVTFNQYVVGFVLLHRNNHAPVVVCSSRLSFLSLSQRSERKSFTYLCMVEEGNTQPPEQDGMNLAAELFKIAQRKGISLDSADMSYVNDDDDDLEDERDEEDDDEEDEVEPNYPQGAINAFLGYDTGNVGEKLAGNVSLTNTQLYSEVKERVLDTAGGFLDFVKPASDDDEDEDESEGESKEPKPYTAPEVVPDSDLTAGEVIMQVLDSLLHNDIPTKNRGVEILFGYSSDGSQIKNEIDLTPSEYGDFLKETEYKVLFQHQGATIDKADYSFDGKKAFFTARLRTGTNPLDVISVNFILSTNGVDDDSCWLIDSMLIRPQSMQRRRRR
jgi:hypothetical protein